MTLFECLNHKLESLEKFLATTEMIRDCVESHDLHMLEDLLRQRQAVVDRVDRIDEQIRRIRAERLSEPQTEEITSLFRSIEEVLERSRILDQRCTEMLALWREDVRAHMARMREGLRVVHGYARRPIRPPKFLNVTR
jgi:hypothetical protein